MKSIDINTIQLSIESPGIHIDDELHNNLIELLEKLGKFYSRIQKCEIILRIQKNDKKNNCLVEARLYIPGKIIFTQQKETDFYKAADKLFEDLHTQLLRHKEKIQD